MFCERTKIRSIFLTDVFKPFNSINAPVTALTPSGFFSNDPKSFKKRHSFGRFFHSDLARLDGERQFTASFRPPWRCSAGSRSRLCLDPSFPEATPVFVWVVAWLNCKLASYSEHSGKGFCSGYISLDLSFHLFGFREGLGEPFKLSSPCLKVVLVLTRWCSVPGFQHTHTHTHTQTHKHTNTTGHCGQIFELLLHQIRGFCFSWSDHSICHVPFGEEWLLYDPSTIEASSVRHFSDGCISWFSHLHYWISFNKS